MDCPVLLDTSNRLDPERADQGNGLALSRAAEILETAAVDQAIREGRPDPAVYVARLKSEKIPRWDKKGLLFVFSDEFRDWLSYCRKFSDHLGIDLLPER